METFKTPRGPMQPKGPKCDYGVGGSKAKMPDPDSLPRSGNYGRDFDHQEVDSSPDQGLPGFPPRSGYFGKK